MTTGNNAFQTIATIPITDVTTQTIHVIGSATRTDGGDTARAGYIRNAVVYRDGGGAVRQGTQQTALTREGGTGSGNYEIQIIASGNNALIQVRGNTGHTVEWRIKYLTVESP